MGQDLERRLKTRNAVRDAQAFSANCHLKEHSWHHPRSQTEPPGLQESHEHARLKHFDCWHILRVSSRREIRGTKDQLLKPLQIFWSQRIKPNWSTQPPFQIRERPPTKTFEQM
jgi:hypothetical protein